MSKDRESERTPETPWWTIRDVHAIRRCGHVYLVAFRVEDRAEIERFMARTAWWNSPQSPGPKRKVPTCPECHNQGNSTMVILTALVDRRS